jgi:type IV pilus assembly protein PilC
MAKFLYQAKSASGQVLQGEIEAQTPQEAAIRLRAQQLFPTKIVPAPKPKAVGSGGGFSLFGKRVKSKDLQVFTRQFATLINAGIPVMDSLKILSEGLRPGLLREASARVKTSIEGGRRLGESMAQVPAVFDRLYVNMIQAGEEAGILDTILNRLAGYMEKTEKLKGQVKGALVYPAVILTFAMIVIAGILMFIIPKFKDFYTSAGKEPPWLTMMVLKLSESMVSKWYIFVGGLIILPFAISRYMQTPEGRATTDRLFLSTPVIGEVVQKSAIARLTRTLSTLLSSGVGLIEAIEISAKTAGNVVIEQALMRSKESVISGRPFAVPLMREKAFPDMVVQMIAIGEQSGTLDVMLGKIADFYEDEVETAVKAMTSLIEPMLMVFLGGLIGILVIAMYLPIFNMADVLGG